MKNCSYGNMKVGGEIFLLFNAFDKFNSNVKKWLQFFFLKKNLNLYILRGFKKLITAFFTSVEV